MTVERSITEKIEFRLAQIRKWNPEVNAIVSMRQENDILDEAFNKEKLPIEEQGELHGEIIAVKDLANAVAKLIPKTNILINKDALPDKRSYSVDFSLYEKLAVNFQPIVSLEKSIIRLKDGLEGINFKNKDFRNSSFMRLNTLRKHINEGRIGKDLNWKIF